MFLELFRQAVIWTIEYFCVLPSPLSYREEDHNSKESVWRERKIDWEIDGPLLNTRCRDRKKKLCYEQARPQSSYST